MRIRWHGHSCFEFGDSKLTVVTDPHDGRTIGIKPPLATADIVLISHDHFDHNMPRVIRGDHTDILFGYGTQTVKGLEITGYRSFHDTQRGAMRGNNTIYKFKMDGMTVCHVGDLGDIPSDDVIEEIKDVDFLFVPVGGFYTMELPELRKFIELVNPRILVPMHYNVAGLSINISSIDPFLDIIPSESVDYVGNEIDIMADELPEYKECWVFDR